MGEKRGTKALEVWCKRVTEGYPGVKVENMTTSWRDGLAFCAIIHHFRPDLIDFHSLDKRDVLHNNELAFRIAERHLGIPALLDAEDMVEYEVPDRLSMLTYLSQFYQTFAQRSPGNSPTSRTPIKRSSLSPEPASLSPASQSPPTKVSARGDSGDAQGRMLRRDPCNKCGQPVFLAERLMVSSARLLYHRTCFRCARCNSQLTLANYYETEDGRFCCETCPDEEKSYSGEPERAEQRAPLATGDDSPSSSEQSRPSSVNVDTNDLPSNDACGSVNNVDRVQSSETEDYAKDQSLSLVQTRRKLFENVSPKDQNSKVCDSGQLKVLKKVKQTEPVKDKLMEPDVTMEDDSAVGESKRRDGVDDVQVEVGEKMLVDSLREDELQVPTLKEDVPPVPKEDGVKAEEDDLKAEEDQVEVAKPSVFGAKEDEPLISKDNESELSFVNAQKDVISVAPAKEVERSVTEAKEEHLGSNSGESKPLVSTAEEDDPLVSEAKEDTQSMSNVKEEKPLACNVMEVGPFTIEEAEDEASKPKPEVAKTNEKDVSLGNMKVEEANEVEVASGSSKDETQMQTDVKSTSRTDDDEEGQAKLEVKGDSECVEVKGDSECVNEPLKSEKEIDLGIKDEGDETKDNEKNSEDHLPQKPPPPAVKVTSETVRKPPVTPRKTSSGKPTTRDKPTVSRTDRYYPAELNPFSNEPDDEDDVPEDVSKKDTSNPFDSDDAEEEEVTLRRKVVTPSPRKSPQRPATHHGGSVRKDDASPRTTSTVDTRRHIPAPRSLNPFWEDGEEPEDDEDDIKPALQKPPVPKPRTVLTFGPDTSLSHGNSPFANRSTLTRSSGKFGSANSLSSVVSSASTMRRKKHAAPPPPVSSANSTLSPKSTSLSPSSAVSVPSSPTLSSGRSTLGRSRKSRPAPAPPSMSPINSNRSTWNPSTHYQSPASDPPSLSTSTPKAKLEDEWQEGKLNKDEVNRNRQNQLSAKIGDMAEELADETSFHSGDKSSHGKWKRKKGPAPPRPIPQRRQIRAIPLKELKRELDDIEVLQLELERQGVNLERTIRRKFDENPNASESSMNPDIEDLVLQLFELVNEKNELFRKQAELMYLRRQQRLEEEHADLEYQIRVLMEQPERNKTDSDKAKEEKLIQRLVEVVERRNEIVECLEMDRLREAEEDHSIHSRLELFASKSLALNDAYINDLYKSTPALTCCALKEKKKKKDKAKKGTLRLHSKDKHVDADKDIDESEVEQVAKEKKTKRRWF